MDQAFLKSIELHKLLGNMKVDGKALSGLLTTEGISFWDVIAPYMVLYRYPKLFDNARKGGFSAQLKDRLRPIFGRFQHQAQKRKWRKPSESMEPAEPGTVNVLGFIPHFYQTILKPVVETMKRHGEKPFVLEEFPSLWGQWTPVIEKESSRSFAKMKRPFKGLLIQKEFEKSLTQHFPEVSISCLKRDLNWLIAKELPFFAIFAPLVASYLKAKKPRLLLTADDSTLRCRTVTILAKRFQIPSLLVQQGLDSSQNPEWQFFSCTHFATMGKNTYDDFYSNGLLKDKMTITGNPGYDHLKTTLEENSKKVRERLQLSSKEILVSFFSQPYYIKAFATPEAREEMIRDFALVSKGFPNARFVLKPHPSEAEKELKALFKGSSIEILGKDWNTSALIQASDTTMTFFSTCGLEALYLKKPLINLHYKNSSDKEMFLKSGATFVATDKASLTQILRGLTTSGAKMLVEKEKAIDAFVMDFAHIPDGKASERVTTLIVRMISNPSCKSVENHS